MRAHSNRLKIQEIFEINIRQSDWLMIEGICRRNNLTLTAGVRLCVFQFFSKPKLDRETVEKIRATITAKYQGHGHYKVESKHRHRLCLYGNDGLMLRLMAAQYNVTITGLVRMALELFLSGLEAALANSELDVVSHGIKVYENTENHYTSLVGDFHNISINCTRFTGLSYWPWQSAINRKKKRLRYQTS